MASPFAAVLLAGGKSRRMGRDKALLSLPNGRPLWEHQRDILLALKPAEWFLSGSWREGFPAGLPWLSDNTPGCCPLAGIAAALEATRSPRLVVLAVDLPAMTAEFLTGLLQEEDGIGVVPWRFDGFYEPLAAVYPKTAVSLAEEQLRKGEFSMQAFIRAMVATGSTIAHPIMEDEAGLFANWNRPADLNV